MWNILCTRKWLLPRMHIAQLPFMKLVLVKNLDLLTLTMHIYGVRIAVALISSVFPLLALLPFLSFCFTFSRLLYILMVISNLICIQITSPGGTPIRGKNAGCRKCLLSLLSSSLPPSSIASVFLLLSPQCVPISSSLSFSLAQTLSLPHHITVPKCVYFDKGAVG